MFNAENSHLRKYLATLGISIAAGSIGLGGLILRSSGDILLKKNDLIQLTPVAQDAIRRRQYLSLLVAEYGPYLVVVGVIIGVALAWYGLHGWAKRQKVTDQIEDTEHSKAEIELRQLTKEERLHKAEQEVAEDAEHEAAVGDEQPVGPEYRRSDKGKPGSPQEFSSLLEERIGFYLTSSDSLGQKLREAFPAGRVITNVVIEQEEKKRREVDAIVFASERNRGYAVDLKFVNADQPRAGQVIENAVWKATMDAKILTSKQLRKGDAVIPVVIWIYPDHNSSMQVSKVLKERTNNANVLAFSRGDFAALPGRELGRILSDLHS